MNIRRHTRTIGATLCAITIVLSGGCGKADDPVAVAEKVDTKAEIAMPGIAETKVIAEEGFIYGLPIVMNYAMEKERYYSVQLVDGNAYNIWLHRQPRNRC